MQNWSCDAWVYEGGLVGRVWKNSWPLLAVNGQQQAILLSKPTIAVVSFSFSVPSSLQHLFVVTFLFFTVLTAYFA